MDDRFVIAVLDTHAVIWAVTNDSRLGKAARSIIQDSPEGQLVLSDISLLEISMLVKKERIQLAGPLHVFLNDIAARFRIHAIDANIASDAMDVDLPHSDPFDRVIVATARKLQAKMLTRDKLITNSKCVTTIW